MVDYAALIESRAATKDKYKLKKVVLSPGGLTVKGLTLRHNSPPDRISGQILLNFRFFFGSKCIQFELYKRRR